MCTPMYISFARLSYFLHPSVPLHYLSFTCYCAQIHVIVLLFYGMRSIFVTRTETIAGKCFRTYSKVVFTWFTLRHNIVHVRHEGSTFIYIRMYTDINYYRCWHGLLSCKYIYTYIPSWIVFTLEWLEVLLIHTYALCRIILFQVEVHWGLHTLEFTSLSWICILLDDIYDDATLNTIELVSCICTYVHTYVHTYIHTYSSRQAEACMSDGVERILSEQWRCSRQLSVESAGGCAGDCVCNYIHFSRLSHVPPPAPARSAMAVGVDSLLHSRRMSFVLHISVLVYCHSLCTVRIRRKG